MSEMGEATQSGTAIENEPVTEIGRSDEPSAEATVEYVNTDMATDVRPTDVRPADVDTELEAMKVRLQQMEAESLSFTPEGAHVGTVKDGSNGENVGEATAAVVALATAAARAVVKEVNAGQGAVSADEAVADADARSIYVGNVDYNATVDELSAYFSECGTINRVTIMTHKPTGQPKGFAYVEFKDQHAVQNATILNESMFKGRQLKIVPKRTNVPGMHRGGFGRGRSRVSRGRGGFYGRRSRGRARGRWVPY